MGISLARLLTGLTVTHTRGDLQVIPTGLQYDSRVVQPGDLFVAVRGFRFDGHEYVEDAISRGCCGLVVEDPVVASWPVPVVQVDNTRLALALIADAFFGQPSRRMALVGITGTNGKTTTTHLTAGIMAAAGWDTGLIGTIENRIRNRVLPGERTTPEAPDVQRLLAQMLEEGVRGCAMEVSSHGLDLQRVDGCRFRVGVFTNLSQDHLDFHGSMENYFRAKARLLDLMAADPEAGSLAVINGDDVWGQRLLRHCPIPALSFGFGETLGLQPQGVRAAPTGVDFEIMETGRAVAQVQLQVPGRFSVYNALAAAGAGRGLGLDWDTIARGLQEAPRVPGRFEPVMEGQEFGVFVDYAHSPDGLENILSSARELEPQRLIVVFGCGGDRDRAKRPLMAQVAGNWADIVLVTSDNPRSEAPEAIIQDILQGIPHSTASRVQVETITDREEAIRQAIRMAQPGDLVMIAGKGHETTQDFGDRVISFDDRQVARQTLKELGGHES